MKILVPNSGNSSIKYTLFDKDKLLGIRHEITGYPHRLRA